MVKALVAIAILLAVVFVRAILANRNKPRDWSRQRVVAAIANALDLDDPGYHDAFDLFLDGPFGRDFGPNADAWLRQTYASLAQR